MTVTESESLFVLQKFTIGGYRRFVVKDVALAMHGGMTGNHHRAMLFASEKEADFFRTMHNLYTFTIAEADGTDDTQEEARDWHNRKKPY
jgi:hypothetical protein